MSALYGRPGRCGLRAGTELGPGADTDGTAAVDFYVEGIAFPQEESKNVD